MGVAKKNWLYERGEVRDREKKREIKLIKGFLSCAGHTIEKVEPYERPDSIFTLRDPRQEKPIKVGIEHTDYLNDEKGEDIYRFWHVVISIVESKIDKDSSLRKVKGYFELNVEQLLEADSKIDRKKDGEKFAKSIAGERIEIVQKFSVTEDIKRKYASQARMWKSEIQIPSRYSNLIKYFTFVELQREDGVVNFEYDWRANVTAAYNGISPKKLTEIIKGKGDKCRNYRRENIDGLWLLIAAPADSIYKSAPSRPDFTKWDNDKLLAACEEVEFDKIFFWSRRPQAWYCQIWPKK